MEDKLKNRPHTSQKVIDEFTKLIDSQDRKGIEKYGTTIDEASDENYDWKLMALEETADLQKYLVKEIEYLRKIIRNFRFNNRKVLLDKVMRENLALEEGLQRTREQRDYYKEQYNTVFQAYEALKKAL